MLHLIPHAGKTTLAARLAKQYRLQHITVKDMLAHATSPELAASEPDLAKVRH